MSEYFIAITVDDYFLSSLEDEEFANEFMSNIMSEFLVVNVIEKKLGEEYIDNEFAAINLDDEALYDYDSGVRIFYGIGEDEEPYEDFLSITDYVDFAYRCGIPPSITEFDDWGDPSNPEIGADGGARVQAKKYDYVVGFITWSGTTPAAEKERVLATYPKFKERFDIAKSLLKQYINYDL